MTDIRNRKSGREGAAASRITQTPSLVVAHRSYNYLSLGTRCALPVLLLGLAGCRIDTMSAICGSPGECAIDASPPAVVPDSSVTEAAVPAPEAGAPDAADATPPTEAAAPDAAPVEPPISGDAWHKKVGRGEVIDPGRFVSTDPGQGRFPLAADGKVAPFVVSSVEYKGAARAIRDLGKDIQAVTRSVEPSIVMDAIPSGATDVVLLGTLGKAPLIDELVAAGKLDVTGIKGRWETFLIQVVDNPKPGVSRALVVAGSDQRGTIFGAYELSGQMGVSPWHWWDDVPAPYRRALYVLGGRHSQGEPAVKFRGFFINDENPQTGRWAKGYAGFGPGKAVVKKPTCDNATGTTANPAGTCTYTDVTYTSGLVHQYWEKVFEAALRMKANYVWPAVWGRQFADDDPENLKTVADYGIVLGTSHEAPMMRGIEEWNIRVDPTTRDSSNVVKHYGTDPWGGNGEWSFARNPEALKKYWQEGIQRMATIGFDGVVTLAMRGTGDLANADTGTDILQQAVKAQQQILADVLKKPMSQIPQAWLLYKEVQTFWDRGMRPQDDATVIWCDDNWGNMRKLQDATEKERAGGYGIYYHFDYVGAGRNYKWADTNLLPNIWEQLNLVYSYGVDRVWVVNVGDMKNEELPLQFFIDYAWNPERWPVSRLEAWGEQWAEQQFGAGYAHEIAALLHEYSKLQSDRKPELTNRKITVDPAIDIESKPGDAVTNSDEAYFAAKYVDGGTIPAAEAQNRPDYDHSPFSLTNYRELETVVANWQALAAETKRVEALLLGGNPEYKDSFYELVGYQIYASANLYELRLAEFKNILYAKQGRAATNAMRDLAQQGLAKDSDMSTFYNTQLAGGKWKDWQTQPKIGYGDQDRYANASWQQPEKDNEALTDELFPKVKTLDLQGPGKLGVAVDGSEQATVLANATVSTPTLPTFAAYQAQPAQYIEIFNGGGQSLTFTLDMPAWLTVELTPNTQVLDSTTKEVRAEFKVNWALAPQGTATGVVHVGTATTGDAGTQTIDVPVKLENPAIPAAGIGFIESNGYVSIEADHYDRMVESAAVSWLRIPDIGRTGSGLTPLPVNAATQKPTAGGSTPHLEYKVYLTSGGAVDAGANKQVTLWTYLSPRNNVQRKAPDGASISKSGNGLRYAVSIDDGVPQEVDINKGCDDIYLNKPWAWHTSDNINRTATTHTVKGAGSHTVKFWMVDPTVVVQKLVLDTGTGEFRDSYFGPPESLRK